MTDRPLVYLVDDDAELRRSVEMLLHSVNLEMRAFPSAEAFLAYDRDADCRRPRCLILDVRLPGMSGLALQRHLADRRACIPIIILTGFASISLAVEAVKAGAVNFLEKPPNRQRLLDQLAEAIERDKQKKSRQSAADELRRRLSRLTPREEYILSLMVGGKTNKVIASECNIALKTACKHTSRVLKKLEVDNAVKLANLLRVAGLSGDPSIN